MVRSPLCGMSIGVVATFERRRSSDRKAVARRRSHSKAAVSFRQAWTDERQYPCVTHLVPGFDSLTMITRHELL